MLETVTSIEDVLADRPPEKESKGRIEILDVSVEFGKGKARHRAVESTRLQISPGEFVCLLGPSGCGKSTLLNTVAGFIPPTTGKVSIDGEEFTEPGPDRGMVFQQYSLFPWKSVRENVAFGPLLAGHGWNEAISTANTFLNMVGLAGFADRYPEELSGGMKQRVGIARALANYPSVLLMDEPFGALDAQTRVMMQESLLKIWAQFRNTVLFVTHDIDEAVFLADRVLVMSASPGRIIADFPVDLDRPRDVEIATGAEFIAIKKRCIEAIRAETLKAFEQQNMKYARHENN